VQAESKKGQEGSPNSGPGEARTILLLHIISVRPSKQPLMVRTFLKVCMELGSYFLFLQEQIKDIIIITQAPPSCRHARPQGRGEFCRTRHARLHCECRRLKDFCVLKTFFLINYVLYTEPAIVANSAKISQLGCKQNQPTQMEAKSANSDAGSLDDDDFFHDHVVGDDDEKRGFIAHAPPPTFMSRLKQNVY
jgi:hypothetical protein